MKYGSDALAHVITGNDWSDAGRITVTTAVSTQASATFLSPDFHTSFSSLVSSTATEAPSTSTSSSVATDLTPSQITLPMIGSQDPTKKALVAPVVGGVVGGVAVAFGVIACLMFACRRGWLGKKQAFSQPQFDQYQPPPEEYNGTTPPIDGTTHLDSNPVYELSNTGDMGGEKQGYTSASINTTPVVSPLMPSPSTVSNEHGGRYAWGQRGVIVDGYGRPVSISEIG